MKRSWNFRAVVLSVLAAASMGGALSMEKTPSRLSDKDAAEVGRKVWQNECGGRIEGLTSWNSGEEFPSLGIGHFIWYPKGQTGPYSESFPSVLKHLQEHGAKLPDWLSPGMGCPWQTREEFLKDQQSARMLELRQLLSSTVGLQTDYLMQRMENALPKMLEKAAPENRDRVKKQFERVLNSGKAGVFCLIDYVNFKGEGVVDTERYKGEGWGMLQVLEHMRETGDPVQAFADSAKEALTRRVANSPPARHEEKWLPGWKNRVDAYHSGSSNKFSN